MYRPTNWKNPHDTNANVYPDEETCLCITRTHNAYEAGADAMYEPAKEEGKRELLEALKKEGHYIDASKYPYGVVLNQVPPIQKLTREFKGHIIIIPEEDKLKEKDSG